MRNLSTVIDSIIAIAPELEPHFDSLKESIQYAAPEMMSMWWNEAAFILNNEADNHPKANDIAAIFSGVPNDD